MTYKTRFAALAASVGIVALAGACKPDLNITNPNAPDVARAVATPGDVRNLIGASFNTWFFGMQGTDACGPCPGLATSVMADNMTMAFGNFGARFNGQEPRLAYNNSSSAGDGLVASAQYDALYGALGAANDGLNAIKRGVKVAVTASAPDETPQFQTFAYLIQGLTMGFEGLIFDRGFVVDEDTPSGGATLQPYTAMADAAVAKFDKAIAAAAGKTWTVPTSFTPGMTLTADAVARFANTFAAREIAYVPRTAAEAATTNWTKVLAYAEKGISTGATPITLQITGDGGSLWYDYMKYYGESQSWVRTDQRLLQLMDPTQPVEYTSVTPPPKAVSADKRLSTDFTFTNNIPYNPARGVYFFSQWSHTRYFIHSFEGENELTGDMPFALPAENDLLIAEALVRLPGGDKARAATLINKTRVTRGNLPGVSAGNTNNELLAAIFYEREIELMNTGGALAWFDRRRIEPALVYNGIPIGNTWAFKGGSNLQLGTPRHLPLPAKELETLGLPVYTYGGAPPNPVFGEK